MKYFLLSLIFFTSCSVKSPSSTINNGQNNSARQSQTDYSNLQKMGRKIVKRNIQGILNVINPMNVSNSQIVTKVCINKGGDISFVELIENETSTLLTHAEKKDVLKAIYGYKYEASQTAPAEECGKLTVKFN